jgi:hypothetical protein
MLLGLAVSCATQALKPEDSYLQLDCLNGSKVENLTFRSSPSLGTLTLLVRSEKSVLAIRKALVNQLGHPKISRLGRRGSELSYSARLIDRRISVQAWPVAQGKGRSLVRITTTDPRPLPDENLRFLGRALVGRTVSALVPYTGGKQTGYILECGPAPDFVALCELAPHTSWSVIHRGGEPHMLRCSTAGWLSTLMLFTPKAHSPVKGPWLSFILDHVEG